MTCIQKMPQAMCFLSWRLTIVRIRASPYAVFLTTNCLAIFFVNVRKTQVFHDGNLLVLFRMQCFNAAWILTVLRGLSFPESDLNLQTAREINGTEPHWSLGAIVFKIHELTWIYNLTSKRLVRHSL